MIVVANVKEEASLICWQHDILDDNMMPCMSDDFKAIDATIPSPEKMSYDFPPYHTGIATNGAPVHLGNSLRFPLHSFVNNDLNPTINPYNTLQTEDIKPDLQSHAFDVAIPAEVNPEHYLINGNGDNINAGDHWQDLLAMREELFAMASCQMEENVLRKTFSKPPKVVVATSNTLKASAARRRHQAKFFCHMGGCKSSFTRKHNLQSE